MKKYTLLFFLISFLFLSKSYSQGFNGLASGNFAGITGVMLQPASIVDSRFKFDINLFSTDVNYSNNYFLLDRKVILKFNKNNFDDYATFKSEYLSQASLSPGQKVFFDINNRTQIPLSFMATTGKKSAIAFNMQLRTMIQGRGISQDFANLAFNNFYNPPQNNTSIDASGISINSLNWAEAGLTYGRVLYSSDRHFIKAAVTGKYLAGLSSISLSSNDLRVQVNGGDSTFDFNSSNVSYRHNKNADFNKLFDKNFSPDANAFGLDAGLVYEYRGNLDNFKYIKNDDETFYDEERRDLNKYIFKLGVSLLDVGMFTFNKPANVNSFSANINNWDIKNAHYNSLSEFDTALAARVIANPNDPRKYNVYLPSALSAQLDVRFVKGLFLNVMSYWPVSLGSNAGQRFNKYGYYTITPRYERRHFGIYIPYTVSQRNGFTDYHRHLLGLTLRAGPMFIGSSNLGTMLFNKNLRAADVHIGFKVGFTYGKPTKSDKVLDVFRPKNKRAGVVEHSSQETDEYQLNQKNGNKNKTGTADEKTPPQDKNRLILNYKDGKVYDVPNSKGNVIILNNNYYYGNAPAVKMSDTITVANFPNEFSDSLQRQRLMLNQLQNKMRADSISRITADSFKIKRMQLDSLIRSMQQLQKQMDSTTNSNNHGLGFTNNDSTISNQSAVANNNLEVENIKSSNDSLHNLIDSLQKINASINMADTAQKARITQNIYKLQKADSAQKAAIAKNAGNIQKMDTAQKNMTAFNNNDLNASSGLKKKDNTLTDTIITVKPVAGALSSNTNSSRELNKLSGAQRKNNEKNAQLLQQQNDLYRQYAAQSASLASDINRLNTQMAMARQYNTGEPNVVYHVTPGNAYNNPPYNNYGYNANNQIPAVAKHEKKTDTVYIRDTVAQIVNRKEPKPKEPKPKETKPEKSTIEQPGFNYTGLPAEIILFGIGKWSVQPIYNNRLNFTAGILKKNPGLNVTVTGHTDATGSKQINEKLSLRRAKSVAAYLTEKGVADTQIIIKSLSFEKPAVTGNTKTARSQNRRVVVKLVNE